MAATLAEAGSGLLLPHSRPEPQGVSWNGNRTTRVEHSRASWDVRALYAPVPNIVTEISEVDVVRRRVLVSDEPHEIRGLTPLPERPRRCASEATAAAPAIAGCRDRLRPVAQSAQGQQEPTSGGDVRHTRMWRPRFKLKRGLCVSCFDRARSRVST